MRSSKWLVSFSVIMSLALVVSAVAGCKSAPSEKTTVNMVMATPFNTWLSTYAIREGLVTSDKVDVKMTLAADYDTQIMAGNYPMGALSTATFAVGVQNNHVPLVALSTFIVQAGALSAQGVNYVFTLAKSSISSPKDLVGKKVGVPDLTSSATSCLMALLKKDYGINETQLTLVNNSPTLLMQLLKSGDIDAALLNQNIGVQASLDATYKVLWNLDKTYIQEYGAPFAASLVVVNSEFQSKNPAAVHAAYDLLKESNAYGEAHLAELAPKYAAQYGQTAYFYIMVYNEHSRVSMNLIEGKTKDSLMTVFQFVMDRGVISSLPDPKAVFKNP